MKQHGFTFIDVIMLVVMCSIVLSLVVFKIVDYKIETGSTAKTSWASYGSLPKDTLLK